MLKKSLAWLLTMALCMSVFAGCGEKKTLPPVSSDSSSKVTEDKVEEKPAQASDTLVVTTAGAVTPAAGIKHVIIEADGVILENAKLETITVSEKLGEGTATLKNVKAKILNANGGGEHSIIILDSDLVTIIANRKDGKQHITINVGSTVTTFTIESEVIADIEGAVEKLVVEDGAKNPEVNILASSRVVEMLIKALTAMQIDAEVESVSITGDAENSTMEVGKGGKVGTLATDVPMTTSGEGAIGTLVTNNKNNLKGSTLAANTTTISQNPLNKNVEEAKPIVKKKPGAVTPPPAADEAPVSGKIELAIIGAEAFPKPYDGTDIAYVTGVDFANLQNGDVLLRGTDYTLNAKFEDVNIGKNKKIIGTVALLPTEKTAKYNLKDGNLVNVAADIFKSVPHNQFTDLVKGFAATVPYSASIDLSKFFKKGAGAGAESYTVVAKAPAAHSSKDAANLVVTACGNFEVSFKTAATDKGDEDKGNLKFTLTVSKIPGTAIAEKLVVVKPTAEGSKDGKITGLDSKKLYEYTTNSGISYTAVAAKATEITGLYAQKYTVRYKGTGSDIKDEGIGTEITIINPEKSEVSFVAMEQTKIVLGKLVSELQSADTVAEPDGVYRFKGELKKIDSWSEFGTNKGYFIALQVNPKVGTTFTDAAELKLYKSNGTEVNGTALLKTDNEIVLHVADALPNPGKQFKVTIDLDGAGADYETTTYTLGTGGLTLAGTNDVALTVKVDGAAADVAGIGEITIQKGAAKPIALTEEGTSNVYKHAAVPTGAYMIFVGGIDTRQTLNVNQATSTTGDLLYYTVTLNTPTGVTTNSTLKASYGAGVDIPTGTPLLKDTEITLTANVDPKASNTTYSSVFSNGTTQIGEAVAGVPAKATFKLAEKLDANVAITATLAPTKITAVADLVVTQPAKKAVPAAATLKVANADYAVTSTVWNVAGEGGKVEATAFKPSTSYTATVTLTAAAGKTFSGDIVPTGALTGANAILKGTISPIDKAENTIVFKITYPALAAAVAPTATVAVTGTAKVGETLTAKATIVEGDFPGTTVAYKWYTSDDAVVGGTDDKVIASAITSIYVLTAADAGKCIYCEVTPNNGGVAANSLATSAVAEKTNAVELTVKVDGAAANVDSITSIKIQKDKATPITLAEEVATNVYKHATVPTGVYKILVNDVDTKQTLNVNQPTTTGDLLYYTVTLTAPTGSTLKASYGAGVDIPTGTPLLKDTEITLTANVDPVVANTTYSSVFSNGTTQIGEAVTGVPATAKFVLTKELDAKVAITATVGVAKITAVADLVVTQPAKNVKPANATVTSTDYTVTSTVWNVAGEGGKVEATAFQPSTSYTATVTLTAAAGKTFSGDIVPTGTLTGANDILKGTISHIDKAENTIVFKITYPALAAAVLPTATVAVTGDAKVGATLTAKATIVDHDFPGTTVTYKWYTSDDAVVGGTDDKVIASAITSTYVLTAADAGKYIYCEVTPTNGGVAVNSAVTVAIAKGDSTKTKPTFIAIAPVANTDVQVTTAAGATVDTTTLSFVVHGTPSNALTDLEFKFAASLPAVTDIIDWKQAATIVADVSYTTGHELYIRAKADATAQLNPTAATECTSLVITVLTAEQVAQQDAINKVKAMFNDASTLDIATLNTATGTATATADNLVAYKAAVEACTTATELETKELIAAIVKGVNDAVAAIESNTSVTLEVLKKATGLADITNYAACGKAITAATTAGTLNTSVLINAMVAAVDKMEAATKTPQTATVENTVAADAVLTTTIGGTTYTVSAPVITTANYLKVVGTGFQLAKVNDTAADVTEAVTFTWIDKTLTYITHELVPCTVTIKQTAKGIANADIAAADTALKADFFSTITPAAGADQAAVKSAITTFIGTKATELKGCTCAISTTGEVFTASTAGVTGTPEGTAGSYAFRVDIEKVGGTKITSTLTFTIVIPAVKFVATAIDVASVTGITAPATGGTPSEVAAVTAGAVTYTVTSITWKDDKNATVTGNFATGTTYHATIVLTATAGNRFTDAAKTAITTTALGTVTNGAISAELEANTLTFDVAYTATT